MFRSVQRYTIRSGILFMLPEKSLGSGCLITLFCPSLDDQVIDLIVISTLGITTVPIAIEIASWANTTTYDGGNNTTNFFLNTVGNISFNDLIMTSTTSTECYNPKCSNKTIILYFYRLAFRYTCLVITIENKILKGLF